MALLKPWDLQYALTRSFSHVLSIPTIFFVSHCLVYLSRASNNVATTEDPHLEPGTVWSDGSRLSGDSHVAQTWCALWYRLYLNMYVCLKYIRMYASWCHCINFTAQEVLSLLSSYNILCNSFLNATSSHVFCAYVRTYNTIDCSQCLSDSKPWSHCTLLCVICCRVF